MSKTERKWLTKVFEALSKFLIEMGKILKEFRLAVFKEPDTKLDMENKKWTVIPLLSSIVLILIMWIWAKYF